MTVSANIFTTSGNINIAKGNAATFTTGAKQTAGTTVVNGAFGVSANNIFVVQGGRIEGTGTINGAVNNTGGIVTGGSDTAAGLFTEAGNYTQGANGTYLAKIGGTGQDTGYDLFNIGGTASLSGKLQVQFLNAFTPYAGETFDVMTYANRVGAFDSIFSLGNNYDYSVTYSDTVATLHVNSLEAVPETGTLVSLGLLMAGGAFALRRLRKRELS